MSEVEKQQLDESIQPSSCDAGFICFRGKVIKSSGEFYDVKVIFTKEDDNLDTENAYIISAYASGRMKRNRIKILNTDTVDIAISLADKSNLLKRDPKVRARITYRYK